MISIYIMRFALISLHIFIGVLISIGIFAIYALYEDNCRNNLDRISLKIILSILALALVIYVNDALTNTYMTFLG